MSTIIEFSQITNILDELKLDSSEIVFLSAGLGNFGILNGIKNHSEYYMNFVKELSIRVPNGAIAVPVYSYSFSDSEQESHFDVENTRSSLGQFSNWFLQNSTEIRTEDPMVSCAFSNKKISQIFNVGLSSYGKQSLFENLLRTDRKVRILNFGLGVKWMPFIHHLDFIQNSPYRYQKFFSGTIKKDLETKKVLWEYHVPVKHPSCEGTGERVGLLALEKGLWNTWILGKARVHSIDYKKYYEFAFNEVAKDPWALAKGPMLTSRVLDHLIKIDLNNDYYQRIGSRKRK